MKQWKSEGKGEFTLSQLGGCGENVVIEDGVRIFHPENIYIGDNVYIGHDTILKGYYKHDLIIGSNSWIGQQCFIHGAGGVTIGEFAGIGPNVRIHAAYHTDPDIPDSTICFRRLHSLPFILKKTATSGSVRLF